MRVEYSLFAAACVTLAAALPAGDGDSTLLDLSTYSDTLDVDKIKKPCTDPLVTNADQDPKKTWDGLGCTDLFRALDTEWTKESATTRLSYVEFMSNKIHGPENMNCGNVDSDGCGDASVQCDDTAFACGYKLLNSLQKVHNMFYNGYKHVDGAHEDLQDYSKSFAEVFAPDLVEESADLGDFIAAMVTLGAVGAGAFVQTVVKASTKAKPYIKDGAILGTAMATPIALNHLNDKLMGDKIDSQIGELLNKVYNSMRTMQADQLKQLFNGSSESNVALEYFVEDGAFLGDDHAVDWKELESEIVKIFLGALIPPVWSLAPTLQNKDRAYFSNPFFVNSNQPCGTLPKDFYHYTGDRDFTETCYENEGWYLMYAKVYGVTGNNPQNPFPAWSWKLYGPPGDSYLLNSDGFLGLTAKDMLASTVEGWKEADHRQNYTASSGGPLYKGTPPFDLEPQYTDGVREPGVVDIPVCAEFQMTMNVLDEFADAQDDHKGPPDSKYFPCG